MTKEQSWNGTNLKLPRLSGRLSEWYILLPPKYATVMLRMPIKALYMFNSVFISVCQAHRSTSIKSYITEYRVKVKSKPSKLLTLMVPCVVCTVGLLHRTGIRAWHTLWFSSEFTLYSQNNFLCATDRKGAMCRMQWALSLCSLTRLLDNKFCLLSNSQYLPNDTWCMDKIGTLKPFVVK